MKVCRDCKYFVNSRKVTTEIFLCVFIWHGIDVLWGSGNRVQFIDHGMKLIDENVIFRDDDALAAVILRKQRQGIIRIFFEIAVADEDTEGFGFFFDAVCARVGLEQVVILEVFIDVQDGERFAVKAG